ncbi:MAG: bifunctional DNA-formamidopyrimidine glycosylase/DNA-(apurinic or apyrimidinic site) lyase [Nakamurella sp.]
MTSAKLRSPAPEVPELPEVEVVRRGLAQHTVGRSITQVEVYSDRAVRRHPGGRSDFEAILAGRTIEGVSRRGKYLWFVLDEGDAVLAHLGMSGQFRVGAGSEGAAAGDASSELHPHLRVRFHFADDGPELDFLDQRTFGGLAFAHGGAELPHEIAHIARDPMDPEFDLDAAIRAVRGKRTEIKRALLDQTVVSGIGNIYADESLWRARVHFRRPTASMTAPAVRGLLIAATDVMNDALAVGGTSFDALYVNVNGESGYFDRSLDAYGRAGLPCRRCGATIIREAFMNRSSFRCPRCQRRPRGLAD